MKKFYYLKLFLFGLLISTMFSNCSDSDDPITPEQSSIEFILPSDNLPVLFEYGETKTVHLKLSNVKQIENITTIAGWTVTTDIANETAIITAPQLSDKSANTYGSIILKGKSEGGKASTSEYAVYTFDYANPWGTFFVMEGNMSDQNGDLAYLDMRMQEYESIYKKANGKDCGNVLQDMFIADGKVYLLSQNGSTINGEDRLVVSDSRTMKKEYSDKLLVSGKNSAWPQHLVVANNKAYIQYSYDVEQYSGIRIFDLKTKTLSENDMEGTYGSFTENGALKGRMVLSRGKIFAGLGNAVVIIDPTKDKVSKKIDFSDKKRQVKGIVKAADNNIYIALTGEFGNSAYSPEFKSSPSIVCIDHEGNIISEKVLPDNITFAAEPWFPSIGLCASFKQDYLYFNSTADFNARQFARYNYKTGTIDNPFITVEDNLYGYMGVHPFTEELFAGISVSFLSTVINVYNQNNPTKVLKEYKYRAASPAGVDFAYRFTDEFINR